MQSTSLRGFNFSCRPHRLMFLFLCSTQYVQRIKDFDSLNNYSQKKILVRKMCFARFKQNNLFSFIFYIYLYSTLKTLSKCSNRFGNLTIIAALDRTKLFLVVPFERIVYHVFAA